MLVVSLNPFVFVTLCYKMVEYIVVSIEHPDALLKLVGHEPQSDEVIPVQVSLQ